MSPLAIYVQYFEALGIEVSYLNRCAGYIPKDTWIAGTDAGYYATWPGLTSSRVRKHLLKSEHTVMGHMKRIRQGI